MYPEIHNKALLITSTPHATVQCSSTQVASIREELHFCTLDLGGGGADVGVVVVYVKM